MLVVQIIVLQGLGHLHHGKTLQDETLTVHEQFHLLLKCWDQVLGEPAV